MKTYRLRIEGVNLSNYVYDTQDLSTIRGGGLLLLDAVKLMQNQIDEVELEPISTGASSGLFEFIALDDDQAKKVQKKIREWLDSHYALKHATVMVDLIEATDHFLVDKESLIALNRWNQMHSPSLAVPVSSGGIRGICSINRVRPATRTYKTPEKKRDPISGSAKVRRDYGRLKKQLFYESHAEMQINREFTNDFNELTDDQNKGNLHHKMAVIYIDGNGFGMIQKDHCKTKVNQKKFDDQIQGYRKRLLTDLIRHMEDNRDDWINNLEKHRFETLLWGGDEIIWVVPAWKGLETLGFFYHHTIEKDWNYDGAKLRHAAGLVFCHQNAPIHRIIDLAKYKLAELAKKDKNREQNLFAYEVLESFDHVSGDFDDYRKKRSPSGARPDSLILNGENIQNVLTEATKLLPHLSRRKLHKLTHKIIKPDWPPSAEERNKIYKSMKEGLPPAASTALDNIKPLLGGEDACWLHLSALWDYLV